MTLTNTTNAMLNISEIFATIQGEASFTGTPSIFIRTQGCDVGCPFCDTKYSWSFDEQRIDDPEKAWQTLIGSPIGSRTAGVKMDPMDLLDRIAKWKPGIRHLVITGGEPLAQPNIIRALVVEAYARDYSVQIETSGTYPINVPLAWITLSPKIGMPGGRKVLAEAVLRADEIKMPIGKEADILKLHQFVQDHALDPRDLPIWVQPISQGKNATQLCLDLCYEYGFRISIQTHKYLGLD